MRTHFLITLLALFPSASTLAWDRHETLAREFPSAWVASVPPAQRAILLQAVDEPDQGMDQNLPDAEDPFDERKWMGGKTGLSSQGFRHMYFGGWKISHPLTTFQLPVSAVGRAPDRVEQTATEARELLRNEARSAEGWRRLGWSLHYAEDLAQPFHAVQVPRLSLIPWQVLLTWPPTEGFKKLVKESTRTLSNYHFAYEGYVLERLKQENSPLRSCISDPEKHATLKTGGISSPRQLALQVAGASVELAPAVGRTTLGFYGSQLKDPGVDLAAKDLDYASLVNQKGNEQAKEALDQATCPALANAALASMWLVRWATQP